MDIPNCLEDLRYDDLSHIFKMLLPIDLVTLASTCKSLRKTTYEYCAVQNKAVDSRSVLRKFCGEDLLLENEIVNLKKLESSEESEVSPIFEYFCYLLYVQRYRVSICNVDWFPHSENEKYIPKIFDEKLKRHIYVLRDVCWLEMWKIFKDVPIGSYVLRMRMKFTNEFSWDSSDKKIVKFRLDVKEDEDFVEKSLVTFKTNQWAKIRKASMRGKTVEKFVNSFQLMNHDKKREWFDFVMVEPIHLDKTSDVRFYFSDVDSNSWNREWLGIILN